MDSFIVNFAELYIKIHTHYDYMENYCKDYIVQSDTYDFEVYPDEHYLSIMNNDPNFSDAYCESISLYEEIAKKLPYYNAFVFHGASITYKDKGLLFTAPSGTGKTTHIKLWRQYFKSDVDIINGDKPIIRIFDDCIKIYGTPFCGKEGWHKNRSANLHSLCIVRRGLTNTIKNIEASDAMIPLYNQMYFSKDDKESALLSMTLFDKLLTSIPIYILECDISEEAVLTSYRGMIHG